MTKNEETEQPRCGDCQWGNPRPDQHDEGVDCYLEPAYYFKHKDSRCRHFAKPGGRTITQITVSIEALEDFKKLLAEKPLIDGPVVANPPIASGPRFIELHSQEEQDSPRSTWVNTLDVRRMQPVKNNWEAKTRLAGQPRGSWIMVTETVAEILALIEEAHQ